MMQPHEAREPDHREIAPPIKPGDFAPSLGKDFQFPRDKPVLVVFLRHCGDPFAEKTFKILTNLANHHPEIDCIAVSQSSQTDTDQWVVEVGGEWEVHILVDEPRALYAAWGLGESTTWYNLNPFTLWKTYKLGTEEGIWNRAEKSGSRWQTGGAFAVDADGYVRWAKPAATADEVPNFKEGLRALGVDVK